MLTPSTIPVQFEPDSEFIATLGSGDQPNGKVKVKIVRPSRYAGFYFVITEQGELLTVFRSKLKPL
jgi:hypothetical protein